MLSGASPPNQSGTGPGVMWRLQNAICGSRGPLETQEFTKVVWVLAFVLIKVRRVRSIFVKRKIMALGQSSPQPLIRSAGRYKSRGSHAFARPGLDLLFPTPTTPICWILLALDVCWRSEAIQICPKQLRAVMHVITGLVSMTAALHDTI